MLNELVVIAHNIRSTHNVGSLLRTAEGLGVTKVYMSGYTPYPKIINDPRLPHISSKLDQQINKTALNAQKSLSWEYFESIEPVLNQLKNEGYLLSGLEQTANSKSLPDFRPPEKLAVVLGSEVDGLDPSIISLLDYCLEIPMVGKKESFNVVEAATMLMYHCLLGKH